jgi:hypothetical protein
LSDSVVGGGKGLDELGTPHGAQNYHFEGLIEALYM